MDFLACFYTNNYIMLHFFLMNSVTSHACLFISSEIDINKYVKKNNNTIKRKSHLNHSKKSSIVTIIDKIQKKENNHKNGIQFISSATESLWKIFNQQISNFKYPHFRKIT